MRPILRRKALARSNKYTSYKMHCMVEVGRINVDMFVWGGKTIVDEQCRSKGPYSTGD
ncbi:hypothetical protein KFK09_011284 [Dendrobium nobile]|uniref:Uncharacterized protein n=1 Tax=Dendrobium nobile TaxID=94219 RepID=A0A8T3BFH8_DENNO|nr:hypothetical protein KFK09_011284 [Dendrobium nobile]